MLQIAGPDKFADLLDGRFAGFNLGIHFINENGKKRRSKFKLGHRLSALKIDGAGLNCFTFHMKMRFGSCLLVAGTIVSGCAHSRSEPSMWPAQTTPSPSNNTTLLSTAEEPAPASNAVPVVISLPPIQPAATPPVSNIPPANIIPIVTPSASLQATVLRYNPSGRFVVLNFPLGQLPEMGHTFFIYHGDSKVGQVKITGPQQDNLIVADVTAGEAQPGDDVREP